MTAGRLTCKRAAWSAVGCALLGCASMTHPTDADARDRRCPPGMAYVDASPPAPAYCIDRWEASLVQLGESGEDEGPFSPYQSVAGHSVRAVSRAGVVPQAYISRNEASEACKASKKRLCSETEWAHACEGKTPTTFPYGDDRKAGYCNDHGRAPLAVLYAGSPDAHGYEAMNDPRLDALPGTVARTGQFAHCRSSFGAFDMVGNLHEWIDDPAGTFRGGYYLDTSINGEGCRYRTVAHDAAYHDYSTGFRCCADAR